MCVDVVDVRRLDACVLHSERDRARRRLTGFIGRHLVKGVTGQGETEDLAVDARARDIACSIGFEHQRPGTFSRDEAIAVPVKRPARLFGRIVSRGERADGIERRDSHLAQRGLGSSGEHDVGVSVLDDAGRVAERVRGGGASGGHRACWAREGGSSSPPRRLPCWG